MIRPIRADEWRELRALRLRALADAPQAFATTLAEAEARTNAEWQENVRRGASGDRQSTFVADEDGRLVGMATGFLPERDAEDGEVVQLVAMWVDPAARRSGIGTRLVDAIRTWAAERGRATVRLAVNEAEAGAVAFYRSLGFRATGERVPIPGDRFVAIEMEARAVQPRSRRSRRARYPRAGSRR